jgi:hypothetical protein
MKLQSGTMVGQYRLHVTDGLCISFDSVGAALAPDVVVLRKYGFPVAVLQFEDADEFWKQWRAAK